LWPAHRRHKGPNAAVLVIRITDIINNSITGIHIIAITRFVIEGGRCVDNR
jgi:hypothetical protein